MSNWRFNNCDEIEHSNGYRLSLNAGRWEEPTDIRPYVPNSIVLTPLEIVRHMREGLEYARINASDNS